MRAIDTNVLLRLIVRDEPAQVAAAEAFVANGVWVPLLVVAETVWALEALYDLKAKEIAANLAALLDHRSLSVESPEVLAAALQTWGAQRGAGFTDCLILEMARARGHLPLGTFDRGLSRLEGTQRLSASAGRASQ